MPLFAKKLPAEEILDVKCSDGSAVPVYVERSARRTTLVSVGWISQTMLRAQAPATMRSSEIERVIIKLLPRLERQRARRSAPASDAALEERAHQLNEQFFQGKLTWQSIRYVGNQRRRYGSCTPGEGTIRISDRMQAVPAWVRDYVLLHELAHLQEPNHSPAFWALVNRYPLVERAKGFLLGLAHADHLPCEEDDDANGA